MTAEAKAAAGGFDIVEGDPREPGVGRLELIAMKQKLTWVFVIAFSGLIGLFMLVLTAPRNHVYDPRIDERNTSVVTKRPQEIMDAILTQAEGLPKQDIALVEIDGRLPTSVATTQSSAIRLRECEFSGMNPSGSMPSFPNQPMTTSLRPTWSTPTGTCGKSK